MTAPDPTRLFRGGLKKLPDPEPVEPSCPSPQHRPPSHIVLENGTYEWTCPNCGGTTTFTVRRPTL